MVTPEVRVLHLHRTCMPPLVLSQLLQVASFRSKLEETKREAEVQARNIIANTIVLRDLVGLTRRSSRSLETMGTRCPSRALRVLCRHVTD